MNHGLAELAELPVSVCVIREIHAELMRSVHGGRLAQGKLRTSQNWIGPACCTLATATFVPLPPHDVSQAHSDLERLLHDGAGPPPLVKVRLAHAPLLGTRNRRLRLKPHPRLFEEKGQ